MISVSTLNNEIYFIILQESTWKLYYHLKALNSIYSIHPTSNINTLVVVMDQSIDEYQIVVVEKQSFAKLTKQQRCQNRFDKVISINKGSHIIAGSEQANYLMKYN